MLQPVQNQSLLLFRVGPVLCCAPSLPVDAIIQPPKLTQPPGSHQGEPGIFRHNQYIVKCIDLRVRFGAPVPATSLLSRFVVTRLGEDWFAFIVDQIIDVIQSPESGWGELPAQLPRGVFTRTFIYKEKIYLYADFARLKTIQGQGYLKAYIQNLQAAEVSPAKERQPVSAPSRPAASGADARIPTQAQASSTSTQTRISPSPPPANPASSVPLTSEKKTACVPASHTRPITPPGTSPATTKHSTRPTMTAGLSRPEPARPAARPTMVSKPLPSQTVRPGTATPVQPVAPVPSRPPITHGTHVETRPVSPVNPDTTSPQHSPQVHSDLYIQGEETGFPWLLLIVLLLLMAGGGGALWWILFPVESSTPVMIHLPSPEQEAAPVQHVSPTLPTVVKPSLSTDTAVLSESTVENNAMPMAPVEKPVSTDNSSTRYQASIEENAQGLTLVLREEVIQDSYPSEPAPDEIAEKAYLSPGKETDTDPVTRDAEQVIEPAEENVVEAVVPSPVAPAQAAKEKVRVTREIIHVVVKGDTLWHIARRYVQDPFRYPELAHLSKIKNPHRIYPGNRIRIRFEQVEKSTDEQKQRRHGQ